MYKKSRSQKGVKPGHIRYRFDYRLNNTRHRKMVVCQKSVVNQIYTDWEKQIINRGTDSDFQLFEIINRYLDFMGQIKSGQSLYSVNVALRLAKLFFQPDKTLNSVRPGDIEDFILWRKHNSVDGERVIKPATVNKSIAYLQGFFSWAIKREYYLKVNPCSRQRLAENNFRVIKLNELEMSELLEKTKQAGGQIQTAMYLALFAGLRRYEAFSLQWSDVNFTKSELTIRAENAKTKRSRVISIPDFLSRHLQAVRKLNPFSVRVLTWSTLLDFRYDWHNLRDKFSFSVLGKSIRYHDLRHIYAQSLVDADVSIYAVTRLMGHADTRMTTGRYANCELDSQLDKVNRLESVYKIV